MNDLKTIKILNGLAHESRLEIYQLLIKYGTAGLNAGKIAEILNISNATLSFHLKEMTHAEILISTQHGRFINYQVNLDTIKNLVDFFKQDCCSLDNNNSCNL